MKRRSTKLFKSVIATLAIATLTIGTIATNTATTSYAANSAINDDNNQPMYRMYCAASGEHLYTSDKNERNTLRNSDIWEYEGVGWMAPKMGNPVYRLFNPSTFEHFYTKDEYEKSVLEASSDWNYEGIAWYTQNSDEGCNVAVYRLFNSSLPGIASHHYTLDINERDTLARNFGWIYEGEAWLAAHDLEIRNEIKATCQHGGYTGDAVCTRCGKTVIDGTETSINVNEHEHTTYHEATGEEYTSEEIVHVDLLCNKMTGPDYGCHNIIYSCDGDELDISLQEKFNMVKQHLIEEHGVTDFSKAITYEEMKDWMDYEKSLHPEYFPDGQDEYDAYSTLIYMPEFQEWWDKKIVEEGYWVIGDQARNISTWGEVTTVIDGDPAYYTCDDCGARWDAY